MTDRAGMAHIPTTPVFGTVKHTGLHYSVLFYPPSSLPPVHRDGLTTSLHSSGCPTTHYVDLIGLELSRDPFASASGALGLSACHHLLKGCSFKSQPGK